jgi:outer membrane protein OmpA-like peptidoglycan-associated protein
MVAAAVALLTGCNKTQTPPPTAAPPAAADAGPAAAPATQSWNPGPAPQVNVSFNPLPTQPGDLPDSHDIAFLKRFQGAKVIGYVARPYDKLTFYDATGATDPGPHSLTIEGQVTRLVYRVPAGHTALEVLRNYEDLAKAAGLAQTSEQPCVSTYGSPAPALFDQLPTGKLDNPAYVGGTNPDFEQPHCYFTAQGTANGQPLMLAVLVAEKHKFLNQTGFDGQPLIYKDGEVVVILDMVGAKAVADQMVTVKAADLADALASKGVVDLYGVYFDTDKTAVKPESDATLGEVATILKIDHSLKLEVSGHTDNTGGAGHNLTLSQGRAQAVVQALVSKYGIDPARLVAKGYGDTKPVAPNSTEDGKAKNRRVELRKI